MDLDSDVSFPIGRECLEDARGKKVIFVCHCLLNANSKVFEGARYPGMFKEIIEIFQKNDFGIVQLPCPELLHYGCNRYWGGKNVFDNAGYRKCCRQQAEIMVNYIENYQRVGIDVACILGCDGSPTCGVNFTNHYANGGGRPKDVERSLIEEKGIFMEEIEKELVSRYLKIPDMYGLGIDICSKSTQEIIEDFQNYIMNKI